jgi:hypothetical protein
MRVGAWLAAGEFAVFPRRGTTRRALDCKDFFQADSFFHVEQMMPQNPCKRWSILDTSRWTGIQTPTLTGKFIKRYLV